MGYKTKPTPPPSLPNHCQFSCSLLFLIKKTTHGYIELLGNPIMAVVITQNFSLFFAEILSFSMGGGSNLLYYAANFLQT